MLKKEGDAKNEFGQPNVLLVLICFLYIYNITSLSKKTMIKELENRI